MARMETTLGGGTVAIGSSGGQADSVPMRAPVRGPQGELPPISVRYAYLDANVKGEIIAGTFRYNRLGSLLPDTSPLSRADDDDSQDSVFRLCTDATGGLTLAPKKQSAGSSVTRFTREVPTPSVFAALWSVFVDLSTHGLKSSGFDTVHVAHAALNHHMVWVIEHSVDFEW